MKPTTLVTIFLLFIYPLMYSKKDIIDAITWETTIIKHLHSKIEAKHLDYRPNEHQRTLKELLEFMTRMTTSLVTFLQNGGYTPEAAKQARLDSEAKNVLTDFDATMDAQITFLETFLADASDEYLDTEIDLFGTGMAMPIKKYIFGIIMKNYAAYGMQLFMYMKSGLEMHDLNSNNLWMAKD